jgi:formate/nitrite transporter
MALYKSLVLALALSHAEAATRSSRPAIGSVLALRGGGPVTNVASVKTPKETYQGMAAKGADNALMPISKIMHQSIMGGCYVGFGGLLSMVVAGQCSGIAASNPGLQKFIFAALFPVNLLLILMSGGQLFTGNSAAVPAALYEGLVSFEDLVKSWATSYLGNIIGCGLFAFAAKYTGILSGGVADLAVGTAMKKCGSAFGPTVVKAIMCNWLVCMAVWLAGSANDLAGKYVGIFFPISTFVAIGLEHSVANMFLLPLGLLGGADLSLGDVITKNLLPVTLGNAIAGALVVGAGYSYQFGKLGEN